VGLELFGLTARYEERKRTSMATYVMLTRLSPDAIPEPSAIDHLGKTVIDKCPEGKWIARRTDRQDQPGSGEGGFEDV
jgi:hypothetical protein